ncbi:hypothetical protein P5G65_14200 [Paenibacillus chondroitinus]|uniref:Uncharacterized protein n=1 Tax=Paenibacillus chondroitinus TaxID=59842 RepID=A0ABU6DBC1_9BACL|nr:MULTISPECIES: hypothetical protein [Paenibacillus]MCY9663237.1 hypothetical protein [Paenibacillus anseongense]MEB4795053.1 hypothetical protein [Paenibacillus chondroitinus]
MRLNGAERVPAGQATLVVIGRCANDSDRLTDSAALIRRNIAVLEI